jgi:hypothetical protein
MSPRCRELGPSERVTRSTWGNLTLSRPPTSVLSRCRPHFAALKLPSPPQRLRDGSCNQLRQKIGVVYGNPETTTGGNALKFYCSVRLDIRRKKAIKRGEETIGSEVKVKVVKNKLAPPFREAEFEILYGTGVNKLGELVDTAEKLGLVEKSGTWYSYGGEKIGQGRDKVLAHLDEHPLLQAQLRTALVAQARRAAQGKPGTNGHTMGAVAAAMPVAEGGVS